MFAGAISVSGRVKFWNLNLESWQAQTGLSKILDMDSSDVNDIHNSRVYTQNVQWCILSEASMFKLNVKRYL